ncbi:hypothetical protein AVEN_152638-1 [Araneus ventricosus]|uniref:Uncharacterized protein n=1 Tax=Araneus ventricosus TaxID=182803 RepID=A0A4Y2NDF8_ARAVE|nr:hypothetical protein AVEN_152638-1 [Araneus ventricosus]
MELQLYETNVTKGGNPEEEEPRRQPHRSQSISFKGGNPAEGEPRRHSQGTYSKSFDGGNPAEREPRRQSQGTYSISFDGGNPTEKGPRRLKNRTHSISFKGEDLVEKKLPDQSDSYRLSFGDEGPKEGESRRHLDGHKRMILKGGDAEEGESGRQTDRRLSLSFNGGDPVEGELRRQSALPHSVILEGGDIFKLQRGQQPEGKSLVDLQGNLGEGESISQRHRQQIPVSYSSTNAHPHGKLQDVIYSDSKRVFDDLARSAQHVKSLVGDILTK